MLSYDVVGNETAKLFAYFAKGIAGDFSPFWAFYQ